MSSIDQSPGTYLFEFIKQGANDLLPETQHFNNLSLEQLAAVEICAYEVNSFVTTFSECLNKQIGQKNVSGDKLLPALIYYIYQALPNTSQEQQLATLRQHLDRLTKNYYAYETILRTKDDVISGDSAFELRASFFSMISCASALQYLCNKLEEAMKKNPSAALELPQEEATAPLEADALSAFQKQLSEIQEAHQQAIVTCKASLESRLSLENCKTTLTELINQITAIIDSLNKQKTKSQIEQNVLAACHEYLNTLSTIQDATKKHTSNADLPTFITQQYEAIQEATETLAKNQDIQNLSKIKHNWLLQKLSNLVRTVYNAINRPLPTWRWLYHPQTRPLQNLFSLGKNTHGTQENPTTLDPHTREEQRLRPTPL